MKQNLLLIVLSLPTLLVALQDTNFFASYKLLRKASSVVDQKLIDSVNDCDERSIQKLFDASEKPDVNVVQQWDVVYPNGIGMGGHTRWFQNMQLGANMRETIYCQEPIFLTAVAKGLVESVKLFLQQGVDANNLVNAQKNTALMIVIFSYKDEGIICYPRDAMLEALVSSDRLNINDGKGGLSPLAIAALNGYTSAVKKLLAAGACVTAPQGEDQPLHCSAQGIHDTPEIAALLLYFGADPYLLNKCDCTFYKCIEQRKDGKKYSDQLQKELEKLHKKVATTLVEEIKEVYFPLPLALIVADYCRPPERTSVEK